MEELKTILMDLQLKLNSIVGRIPESHITDRTSVSTGRALSMSKSPVESHSGESELPGEGPNGCPEQYHSAVLVSFHKWARIILSLYIDKVRSSFVRVFNRSRTLLFFLGFLCRLPALSKECPQPHMACSTAKVRTPENDFKCSV
jgi:hypothetical protein